MNIKKRQTKGKTATEGCCSDSVAEVVRVQGNVKEKQTLQNQRTYSKLTLYSSLVAILATAAIFYVFIDECKSCLSAKLSFDRECAQQQLKTYAIYNRKQSDSHLRHVHRVLASLGYARSLSDPLGDDWDLLWAHDYPFIKEFSKLKNLSAHQRVNHIPGCGYIASKVELSTSNLKYILPAFRLPHDSQKFLDYTAQFPNKKFVTKHNEHREIRIQHVDTIRLGGNGRFVQVFVDDPLLISGHMFDIGVYAIITSIQPLRIYVYNGDVLLRFCPEAYEPFDGSNLNKYVIGDDYRPIWQVPAIQYWYKSLGYSMRDSLTAYLHAEGRDARPIWRQIEDAIVIAILDKQSKIVEVVKRFKSKRNFFEMMRFDFLVDSGLQVHLLEANMSPNLSSAHFKPNRLLYEQVIFNVFGLVGLADRAQSALSMRSEEDRAMETSAKNLLVSPNLCASALCRNNCDDIECKLCKACLVQDQELYQDLRDAHREHLNRGDCKRVYPPSMMTIGELPSPLTANWSSTQDQLMHLWFKAKCNLDSTWC